MSYNDWSLSYKKVLSAFPKVPASALKYLEYSLGVLGILGFLDAAYLTILHYKNAIPPCTIHGCEVVLTSKFATIGGIPISLIGVGYYLAIIILVGVLLTVIPAQAGIQGKNGSRIKSGMTLGSLLTSIPTLLVLLTGAGLLIGIFLVILQAFVLHAFCQYCLASEVIDFLLFDCAWWLWRRSA